MGKSPLYNQYTKKKKLQNNVILYERHPFFYNEKEIKNEKLILKYR